MNSTCFNKKIMELESIPLLLPCRSFQVSQIFVLQSDSFCNLSWLGNEDSGSCFSRCIRLKCWQLLAGRGGWLLMCFAGNFIGGGVKGSTPPPPSFFSVIFTCLISACLLRPKGSVCQAYRVKRRQQSTDLDHQISEFVPPHDCQRTVRWRQFSSRAAGESQTHRVSLLKRASIEKNVVMGKLQEFDITFANNKVVYSPGESIGGAVKIRISNSLQYKGNNNNNNVCSKGRDECCPMKRSGTHQCWAKFFSVARQRCCRDHAFKMPAHIFPKLMLLMLYVVKWVTFFPWCPFFPVLNYEFVQLEFHFFELNCCNKWSSPMTFI